MKVLGALSLLYPQILEEAAREQGERGLRFGPALHPPDAAV